MSDELKWKQRGPNESNWRARNGTDDGTYIAYVLNGCVQGVLLPDDPPGVIRDSISIYVGNPGSLAEAKDACQDHHYAVARAARWALYMRDNEPPSVEGREQ